MPPDEESAPFPRVEIYSRRVAALWRQTKQWQWNSSRKRRQVSYHTSPPVRCPTFSTNSKQASSPLALAASASLVWLCLDCSRRAASLSSACPVESLRDFFEDPPPPPRHHFLLLAFFPYPYLQSVVLMEMALVVYKRHCTAPCGAALGQPPRQPSGYRQRCTH
mgnify:CR=1 FL=1